MSENIYKFLQGDVDGELDSVHLADFPSFDEKLTEESEEILKNMKKARDIVSQVLSIRVEKALPVRQVLNSIAILKENNIPEEYKKLILDETNIKNIEVVSSLDEKSSWEPDISNSVKLDMEITPELLKEGKLRDFIRNIQDLRKEMGLSISDEIILTYKKDDGTEEIVDSFNEEIKKKLLAKDIIAGEETKVEKA